MRISVVLPRQGDLAQDGARGSGCILLFRPADLRQSAGTTEFCTRVFHDPKDWPETSRSWKDTKLYMACLDKDPMICQGFQLARKQTVAQAVGIARLRYAEAGMPSLRAGTCSHQGGIWLHNRPS